MLSSLSKYESDAPVILRVILGIVFLHAGLTKIFAFGAEGFAKMLSFLPLPLFWVWVVIIVEVVGGLFLILGLWVRWTGIPAAIDMAVATGVVWTSNGFAAAYAPLFGFAMAIALLILGAGCWSLEKAAFGKEC